MTYSSVIMHGVHGAPGLPAAVVRSGCVGPVGPVGLVGNPGNYTMAEEFHDLDGELLYKTVRCEKTTINETIEYGSIFEGNIYQIRQIKKCSCGSIHIDIGLINPIGKINICLNPEHFPGVKPNKIWDFLKERAKIGNLDGLAVLSFCNTIWVKYDPSIFTIVTPKEKIRQDKIKEILS